MLISDLAQHVRLETPGILDSIIVQAIASTAADFCVRTRVWDEIKAPVALIDNTSQYAMTAPADARCLTISQVWSASEEMTPATLADIARVLPAWQSATAPLPRFYNAAKDWSAITVYPTPLDANGALLTFRAQYAPLNTATTLPDFLANNFLDALTSGAKARLFAQSGVPWANPAASTYHQGIYDNLVVESRITQLQDRVPSASRVAPRRFF